MINNKTSLPTSVDSVTFFFFVGGSSCEWWDFTLINQSFNKGFQQEWVSDCCLMQNEQFISYIMVRKSYNSMIDWLLLNVQQYFSYIQDENKLNNIGLGIYFSYIFLSFSLVEETGVPRENHQSATSHSIIYKNNKEIREGISPNSLNYKLSADL